MIWQRRMLCRSDAPRTGPLVRDAGDARDARDVERAGRAGRAGHGGGRCSPRATMGPKASDDSQSWKSEPYATEHGHRI